MSRGPKSGPVRAGLLIAGIVLGQAVLYGPSLVGRTVLLPLDLLAQPGWYLPQTPETAGLAPHNVVLSDPVLQYEVWRRFAAEEVRAGRLPLWNPYNYAGSPLVLSYSPSNLIYLLVPTAITLAWTQVLQALIAGLGAYLFFRRVLAVGSTPALVGGICYPVTGFFVLWQAYPLSSAAALLPWMLLATDRAIRRPGGWGGPGLAAVTCLALMSSVDIAGQALLATAVYAVWCVIDAHGWPPAPRRALRPLAAVAGGWLLGLLLAAPFVLPLADYVREGARMAERARGVEERPPAGPSALPEVVLPDVHGSWQRDSVRLVGGNRLESAAATYSGLLATLLVAPLALGSRRHRSRNLLWLTLAALGLAWSVGLPGVVDLMRLPGLKMMAFNRAVFVSSFAIVALAVTGLSRIGRGERAGRGGTWLFAILLTLLAGWLAYRLTWLPDLVSARLSPGVELGAAAGLPDAAAVERVRRGLAASHVAGIAWCALALAGWLASRSGLARRRWLVPLLGGLWLAELLLFAHGVSPQVDPKLYYPEVEILERLRAAPPGRVVGIGTLPPGLNLRYRLRDVRGYDAVDPARLVELLGAAADRPPAIGTPAKTMWFRPRTLELADRGARVPPILDLLGVRYLVFRGEPPAGFTPKLAGNDYWVAENERALPRAFVPRRVERVVDGERRLRLLASPEFDPREVAYVEADVGLAGEVRGSAEIVSESPLRVTLATDLETPGMVVLSDRWHAGWRAQIDGEPAAVLRANHAVRGVVVPAGRSTVELTYEPASLAVGLRLAAAALAGLAVWAVLVMRGRRSAGGEARAAPGSGHPKGGAVAV